MVGLMSEIIKKGALGMTRAMPSLVDCLQHSVLIL